MQCGPPVSEVSASVGMKPGPAPEAIGPSRRSRSAGEIDLLATDGVLVRMMPPGSLEQVVFRMDALHRVVAAGIPVLNPPRAVEAAVDKYLTLSLLDAGRHLGSRHLGWRIGDGCFGGIQGARG